MPTTLTEALLTTVRDTIAQTEPKVLRPVVGINPPSKHQTRSKLALALAAIIEVADALEHKAKREQERENSDDEDDKRVEAQLASIESTARKTLQRELAALLDEVLIRLDKLSN